MKADSKANQDLDDALRALDSEEGEAAATGAPGMPSPTLETLETHRRPQPEIACARCPNSVWFASPAQLKCYCRVMYLVTWSSQEPGEITHCDGEFL